MLGCAHTPLAGDVPSTMGPSVAKLIKVVNGEEDGTCSVFKVGMDLAMTAGHCCEKGTDGEMVSYHAVEGAAIPGAGFEIRHDDDKHDVCILRGMMKGAPLRLAHHDPVQGERVWTAGYPKGVFLISEGLWSGRDSDGDGLASVAVWGGASGSPVMNRDGKVIGILRAYYPPMSNMAIIAPIEWVRATYLLGHAAK